MLYKSSYKLLIYLRELANISIKRVGYFCICVEILNEPMLNSISLPMRDSLKRGEVNWWNMQEYARPIKL